MHPSESGKHFDPMVCDAFIQCWSRIEEIREHLSDETDLIADSSRLDEFTETPLASDLLLKAASTKAF